MVAEVDGNEIVSLRGDEEHPLTQGYFCVKGLAARDEHVMEDRMRASRKRVAGGRHVEIDVEQALDEIHERLAGIIERHGPRAVALYYGTGANNNSVCHSAMKGWVRLVGTPYVFSSMTVDQSAKWVAAGRMGIFTTGQHSLFDVEVGLMVGMNPVVSHSGLPLVPFHDPTARIREAKRRGAKLIVVDPRRTETARFADIHLQSKPGEDPALLAGMIHVILAEGLYDRAFCDRFVTSLDALRDGVADFTPDYAAERAGVTRDLLVEAARTFARARRKTASSGTGPNMAPWSNLAEHLVGALNAITGAYIRAGDIVGRNTGAYYGMQLGPTESVIPPMRPWEREPKLRTADVGPMFGEYPTALLPDEIAGRGDDRIRALIVVGGNLVKALGDPRRTAHALRTLELLVTLDPRATETAALSHYAIATSVPYERLDCTAMYDNLFVVPFAQVATPVVERPNGVIDDWEFFWGLARRMRKPLPLKRPMFGAAHDDIPGPELLLAPEPKPRTEDLVRWVASQGGVPYDALVAHPEGVLAEVSHLKVEPAGADDGARLDVFPSDVADELSRAKRDRAASPFPFRLTVRRLLETMNSAYRCAPRTRQRHPVNPAYMNPDDMAAAGIREGSVVEIRSAHDAIVARVSADLGMRRGAVALSHGWGALDAGSDPSGETGAFTGRLISLEDRHESINAMPWQSAIPVDIRPWRSPET